MQRAEIVIVGGGVAGLALALQLGRQGRDVLVLDKAPLPRDKVCGEGVMPLGLAALRRLDIDIDGLPGAYFRGLAYRSAGQSAELAFTPGAMGRGLRRTVLIGALERAVRAQPGVRMAQDAALGLLRERGHIVGVRARGGDYRAPIVVAADGVQATLARAAGIPLRHRGYRMGMRLHVRTPRAAQMARVCVGLFPPCDIYLAPVDADTLLATTMTTREVYRRIFPRYEAFLRASPYAPWFAGAEAASPVLGWYHPLFEPRRFAQAGLLLVGDAGGGIDPCLGMGMSLALLTAEQAVPAVTGMLDDPARAGHHAESYHRARVELLRHYRAFDRIFRRLVASPAGSATLVWAMRHWPQTADGLLSIIAERRPWKSLVLRDLVRPLVWGRVTGDRRTAGGGSRRRWPASLFRLWSRYD